MNFTILMLHSRYCRTYFVQNQFVSLYNYKDMLLFI